MDPPLTYWWDDDDEGVTHEVVQGEGGEQGDPLMPALYALGQHRALVAINDQLLPTERLLAFHDDLYVLCSPHRVADVHIVVATSPLGALPDLGPSREDPNLEQGRRGTQRMARSNSYSSLG